MTQNIWKGGNGVWGTAGNWSGGLPNSATADVTITAAGAYTVTLAAGTSYTVDSVTLNNGGVSFDLNGTLSLAGTLADFMFDGGQFVLGTAGSLVGGTLDIDSGTLVAKGGHLSTADFILGSSGSIALGGTALTIGGNAFLNGTVYGNNSAGNSLVITGSADLNGGMYLENHATLVVSGTFAEAGGYQNYLYLGNGGTNNATVLINAGGVYDLTATAGDYESYIYQYGGGAAASGRWRHADNRPAGACRGDEIRLAFAAAPAGQNARRPGDRFRCFDSCALDQPGGLVAEATARTAGGNHLGGAEDFLRRHAAAGAGSNAKANTHRQTLVLRDG